MSVEQARLEDAQREEQRLHAEYVDSVTKTNDLITKQNTAANTANAASQRAAQHEQASRVSQAMADRHGAASDMHRQASMGAGPMQHSVNLSLDVGAQSGLTTMATHSIHQGGRQIASASSRYNSVESYNQRAVNVLAMAHARQPAREVPLVIREPLSQLQEFVAQNSQHLQGYELPAINLANLYAEQGSSCFHDFVPGVTPAINFGQKVLEQTYFMDKQTAVSNLSFTPQATFNVESNSSTTHFAIRQFKQSNWQPSEEIAGDRLSLVTGRKQSLFDRVAKSTIDTAVTVLTGSSAAEASPLLASSNLMAGTVPPIVAGASKTSTPYSFKQLGRELLDAGHKAMLLSFILTNPGMGKNVYDVLVTPMHQPTREDVTLPGGGSVKVNTTVPPSRATEQDRDAHHTGHYGSGPTVEETTVPPYNAHQGDSLHFMFKGNMREGSTREHAPDPDKRYHIPPRTLSGFPEAVPVDKKSTRARWKMPDQTILEWDYQHGELEKYSKNGKHLGAYDPNTGVKLKDPVRGRKIEI